MKFRSYCYLFVLAACGQGINNHPVDGGTPPPDVPDVPDVPDAPSAETQPLGMNDISMVMPTAFSGVFGKMTETRVPRELYVRLVTSHLDITRDFNEFLIFAIRFDLCNRVVVGPCQEGADGSLRLVFQPLLTGVIGADAGLHAFYTIPAADLGYVVNELRAIARLGRTQQVLTGPISDAPFEFFDGMPRLHALLDKYATPDRLIQLTMMGQDERSTEPRVVFRGLELRDGKMVDIDIPTVPATEQHVALVDTDPSYTVTPVADTPVGTARALSSGAFDAATVDEKRTAIDAMLATENPNLFTANDLQCADCHVSTYLARHRARVAGVDINSLPSKFTTTHDVSVSQGISETKEHSLHAFSWFVSDLAISQRVANETAMVLDEIERRFPAPKTP